MLLFSRESGRFAHELPFGTVGEKVTKFINLRFWNQREIHYFEMHAPLHERHTHMFASCPHLFFRFWMLSEALLKWHVSSCTTLACKRNEITIAQQRCELGLVEHVYLHDTLCVLICSYVGKRNTTIEALGRIGQLCFFWMSMFWRSRVHTSSTSMHVTHSKCVRSVLSRRVCLSRASPTNDFQGLRERRRRERRKIGDIAGKKHQYPCLSHAFSAVAPPSLISNLGVSPTLNENSRGFAPAYGRILGGVRPSRPRF